MIKINQGKRTTVIADQVRLLRDQLLTECDWRALPDSPGDRVAWMEYRQQLRDITQQAGFPDNVTWPTPPAV